LPGSTSSLSLWATTIAESLSLLCTATTVRNCCCCDLVDDASRTTCRRGIRLYAPSARGARRESGSLFIFNRDGDLFLGERGRARAAFVINALQIRRGIALGRCMLDRNDEWDGSTVSSRTGKRLRGYAPNLEN